MGRITLEILGAAIAKVGSMDLQQKERLADEIYRHQPKLLASVLVQQRLGVSYAKMEFLIGILLVGYQAMKETGLKWPLISADEQERQLTRATAVVRFFASSDSNSQEQIISRHIDEFPEKVLLAFVTNEVKGWLERLSQERDEAESDKYVMLAAANLVNYVAYASALDP